MLRSRTHNLGYSSLHPRCHARLALLPFARSKHHTRSPPPPLHPRVTPPLRFLSPSSCPLSLTFDQLAQFHYGAFRFPCHPPPRWRERFLYPPVFLTFTGLESPKSSFRSFYTLPFFFVSLGDTLFRFLPSWTFPFRSTPRPLVV